VLDGLAKPSSSKSKSRIQEVNEWEESHG
jgi:hypothetical protein